MYLSGAFHLSDKAMVEVIREDVQGDVGHNLGDPIAGGPRSWSEMVKRSHFLIT